MIVVDTNVLIYAADRSSINHSAAHGWLTETLAGGELLGLPWASVLGFIRITTNPRVLTAPLTAEQAMEIVRAWLGHPRVTTPEPGPRHLQILTGLLVESGAAGNRTTDSFLAALALEVGGSVATFDRDFGRYRVPIVVPGADA